MVGALSRPGGSPWPMPRRPGACASGRPAGKSSVGQFAAACRECKRPGFGESLGRLPDRARDRPGRNGHRLRGHPIVAGTPRGVEGPAVCGHFRRQASATLPAGGPGRGAAPSHEHRPGVRRRLRARDSLLRHATHRRPIVGCAGSATARAGGNGPAGNRFCRYVVSQPQPRIITLQFDQHDRRLDACIVGRCEGDPSGNGRRPGRRNANSAFGPFFHPPCRQGAGTVPHHRAVHGPSCRSPGICPSAGRRSPRHQAGKPVDRLPRERVDHGLRAGPLPRCSGVDPNGRHSRHDPLHES